MTTDSTISTLNGLIKTALDSMKGYQDAAKDAESTQFATMFAEFARDRSAAATELQAEVRRLGGNLEDDSSFLAAAHRTFMESRRSLATTTKRPFRKWSGVKITSRPSLKARCATRTWIRHRVLS